MLKALFISYLREVKTTEPGARTEAFMKHLDALGNPEELDFLKLNEFGYADDEKIRQFLVGSDCYGGCLVTRN